MKIIDSANKLTSFIKQENGKQSSKEQLHHSIYLSQAPDMINLLKTNPVFKTAEKNEEFFKALSDIVHVRNYQPGDIIIKTGDIAKAMFFIIKGSVFIINEDVESPIAELTPPAFFGEIGLLFNVNRIATVTAKSKCVLAAILSEELKPILEKYPEIAIAMRDEANERIDQLKKSGASNNPVAIPINIGEKVIDFSGRDSSRSLGSRRTSEIFVTAPQSPVEGQLERRLSCRGLSALEDILKPLAGLNEEDEEGDTDSSEAENENEDKTSDSVGDLKSTPVSASNSEIPSPTSPGSPVRPTPQIILLKHGGMGQRRTSVAVWSDDKLMHLLSNVNSPSPSKPARNMRDFTDIENSESLSLSSVEANYANFGIFERSVILNLLPYLDFFTLVVVRNLNKAFDSLVCEEVSKGVQFNQMFPMSSTNPIILQVNLSSKNKRINDESIEDIVTIYGQSIISLNLKSCWSITDKGLLSITLKAPFITTLNLNSVWNLTDVGMSSLSNLTSLKTLDLSNCRKVTDVGVLVVLSGCNTLENLELSYCKNLTDKIFNHIIWPNIKKLNIQRCTNITDAGFAYWASLFPERESLECLTRTHSEETSIEDFQPEETIRSTSFGNIETTPLQLRTTQFDMRELNLSDCSFLTNDTILYLSTACKNLETLSLSFCCSLTEEAITILASNCINISVLDVSYCGNAVTNDAINKISKNMTQLQKFSVRGCAQVTDVGIGYLSNVFGERHMYLNHTQCRKVSKDYIFPELWTVVVDTAATVKGSSTVISHSRSSTC